MPYSMRKLYNKPKCYTVYNVNTRKKFSKCSTKINAEKQLRLLRAIQYNKDFVPRRQIRPPNNNNTTKIVQKNKTSRNRRRQTRRKSLK